MLRILREDINNIKEMPLECIKGATLLSKEEVEELLTEEERQCVYKGEVCCWWLRTAGRNSVYSRLVYYYCYTYGRISSAYPDIGIRPALIINLQSSSLSIGDMFEFDDHTFKIISSGLALCDTIIDVYPFRKNYTASDANVYEKSDIKKYIDNWFNKAMEDEENRKLGYKTDDEIFNDDFDF